MSKIILEKLQQKGNARKTKTMMLDKHNKDLGIVFSLISTYNNIEQVQ